MGWRIAPNSLKDHALNTDGGAHENVGTNADAVRWVLESDLTDDDRAWLVYFIARYPGLRFARESDAQLDAWQERDALTFPRWYRTLRTTLVGPATNPPADRAPEVRFDGEFYYCVDGGPWLGRDEVPAPWYDLSCAGYANSEDRDSMFGGAGVYPVGGVFATNEYLAVDARDPARQAVLRFNLEDLWDASYEDRSAAESVFDVFASYPRMLASVDDVRLPDGTVVVASPAGVACQVLDLYRDADDSLRRVCELLACGETDAARRACADLAEVDDADGTADGDARDDATGDDITAAKAMVMLSVLAETRGDSESALSWWRRAAARDATVAFEPFHALAMIPKCRHDLAGTTRWLRRFVDHGHPRAALAAAHLGELCYWLGDKSAAIGWYRHTLALTTDPELIGEAAQRTGEILTERGEHEAAAPLLRLAKNTGSLTLVDGVVVFS